MKLQERLTSLNTISRGTEGARPPRTVAALLLPVVLVATALIVQRRRGTTVAPAPVSKNGASPAGARAAAVGKRHRPRNIVRYYALGLLINVLERDSTRKALLSVLRAARNRA
jgi:hypothetical protein